MEFVELNKTEFMDVQKTYSRPSFWQTSFMGDFQIARGKKVAYVGVKEGSEIVASALLTISSLRFGFTKADIIRGANLDYENKELVAFFFQNIKKFVKRYRCISLSMNPYVVRAKRNGDGELVDGELNDQVVDNLKDIGFRHLGFTKGYTNGEPRWIYCLDVEGKTAKDLTSEFVKKRLKNQINGFARKGMRTRTLQESELPIFRNMMIHTGDRQGFEAREIEYYEEFYKNFKDACSFLVLEMHVNEYEKTCNDSIHKCEQRITKIKEKMAVQEDEALTHKLSVLEGELEIEQKRFAEITELKEKHGEVIPMSSGCFLTYGNEILYLFGGSYDEFMKYCSSTAIQWEMINQAIEKHKLRYNFYGISGYFEEGEEGYGVYEFKRGFGGYIEELIGDFELITSPMYHVYHILKKLKK